MMIRCLLNGETTIGNNGKEEEPLRAMSKL
jgi:hypothetical protein